MIYFDTDQIEGIMNFKQNHLLYISILLLVAALPLLSGLYPAVNFTKERIDITVYGDRIKMRGIYVYENPFPFPIVQGYSIPLPVDPDNPEPVLLSASLLSKGRRPIPIRFILGEHRFGLTFEPLEKIKVQVQYQQEAPGANARYILTTTQPWKKPLIEGQYMLHAENVEITSSNYALEKEDATLSYFRKYQFMPQYDWNFTWRAF